jgi:hypothetical protein
MSTQHQANHRVPEVIVHSLSSILDAIVFGCPELSWNRVFIVIDRLSQERVLTMCFKGRGEYSIHSPDNVQYDGPYDANA